MVFSLFKKQPEKMVPRPAVVPRPAAGSKDTKAPVGEQAREESPKETSPSGFSDFGFTESSLDFQVNDLVIDPINEPAEEAAVLFADNQDQAAQKVLEEALKSHQSAQAERLWLMLFDLYRISGQQAAFEAISIDYARAYEKSPPIWGGGAESEPSEAANTSTSKGRGGSVLFKGNILGSNASSFDAVRQALEKNPSVRLDIAKVKQVDAEGSAILLKLLLHARKNKRVIELLGRDALVSLVKNSIEEGKKKMPAAGKECWLLLLELLQQQGRQEVFEELAIDYAVTFEESPPSWESAWVAAPEPVVQEAAEEEDNAENDGAYVLSGDIKSSHFTDLPDFAKEQDSLLIDCKKLIRIDFVSAGALLNKLTTVRNTGKQIVFRYPNYMVAELFRVVGLNAVAIAVFAKQ
jgi:ABC-type transporter Mla MlaB component